MPDRLRTALEQTLTGLLPKLANYLRWEYRVLSVVPGPPVLISGVPVDVTCPHGPLANITLWPGSDGGYAIPATGSLILVEFHDGNPQKPAVCGLDPSSVPILTTLGGSVGAKPLARVGDTVTITQAEITAATMTAGGNPVMVTLPLQCLITSGSAKVVSG